MLAGDCWNEGPTANCLEALRSDPPVGTGLPDPNRQMRRQTSVPTLADRVHQSAFKSNFPDRVLICQDMCPKTNSLISAATNLDQGRPRSATIGEPPSAKIDQGKTRLADLPFEKGRERTIILLTKPGELAKGAQRSKRKSWEYRQKRVNRLKSPHCSNPLRA
ncbi:hypothetical protein B0H19DRAFT_1079930 [Mycena capillaripes]|nr:hypothetical protein B0H19DRAFT_1079930 [Mycena capillaripes]